MTGPNPATLFPLPEHKRVVFLKNCITQPNIQVGEYTYYDDPMDATAFERQNVLYHYPHSGDRLIIGKFCMIATGTRFIMNGANHYLDGLTTYPFQMHGNGWADIEPPDFAWPTKGDTIVGHDVWFGYESLVMPGVRIGHGAIIATRSVVAHDVPDYAVVAGNPAQVRKLRFDPPTIERLLRLSWWDWPPEQLTKALPLLLARNLHALEAMAHCRLPQSCGHEN